MGKGEKELDVESLTSFFPSLGEAEEEGKDELPEGESALGEKEEDMGMEEEITSLGEEETCADEGDKVDEKKGGEEDDDVEISEAEISKVYEAALKTEATVSKSFGDMTKMGELEEVDPGAGIVDVKSGEHAWEKETPPKKEDYTVKEAIKRGLEENKKLRESLGRAIKMIRQLGGRLHEVNLFNAKVLHVNRLLNKNGKLSTEQKNLALESIDKASTIKEVKMVYETIVRSFKATSLKEGTMGARAPKGNAQRARRPGASAPGVLRESADRADTSGARNSRWTQLAGIVG